MTLGIVCRTVRLELVTELARAVAASTRCHTRDHTPDLGECSARWTRNGRSSLISVLPSSGEGTEKRLGCLGIGRVEGAAGLQEYVTAGLAASVCGLDFALIVFPLLVL